jgi:predicted dehydrogenase
MLPVQPAARPAAAQRGRLPMTDPGSVRWGILGTANIARAAFLPALRQAGGTAALVAGRDRQRAADYAAANGVDRAVEGYQRLIDDPAVDALYIPLPNALHAEWTIRALQAGKPVLCEKPLTGNLADTRRVLGVAEQTGTLLWEAFVFPFSRQFEQIRDLLADGAIGELREVQSDFHFRIGRPAGNIRFSAELEGGALRDVGCYPVRLAGELLGDHDTAWAAREEASPGVDVETWGSLGYPGGRRLLLSCGMRRGYDTFSRLLGTTGQIEISNPFHPGPADEYVIRAEGAEPRRVAAAGDEPSFTAAIRHINAAMTGNEQPRQLAVDTSLRTAQALHDLASAG